MRALALDFRPRRFSRPGLACLGAGFLAVAAVLADYREVASQSDDWRGQLERLQQPARRRPPPRAGDDDREAQQLMQAARGVARDLRRPWESLFAALEAARTEDVALLGVSPDAARGVVRITGEARSRETLLAFIERLGQEKGLRNAVLMADQIQPQDPEKPVRFLIAADWVGAA